MYKWMVERVFFWGRQITAVLWALIGQLKLAQEVKSKFHFILKALFLNKETHYMSIVYLRRFEVTGSRFNIQIYN